MESRSVFPLDQIYRDRFSKEINQNFSVIAPAGVGKTKTIVDRIVQIAQDDEQNDRDWLSKLIVVTFTNRAADEMQMRARSAIFEQEFSPTLLSRFNQVFFGTIHRLCLRLLQMHGYHLGLPTNPQSLENPRELWLEFLRQTSYPAKNMPETLRHQLFRFIEPNCLLELVSNGLSYREALTSPFSSFPEIDYEKLLQHPPPIKHQSRKALQRHQEQLKKWLQKLQDPERFVGLLPVPEIKDIFSTTWSETFDPLRQWLTITALSFIQNVAAEYQTFRIQKGVLTFEDQISLTTRLFRNETCRHLLRDRRFHIILDEAQDTDLTQFEVLLNLAAEQNEPTLLHEILPAPGRFCMVGDPQQSIYRDRADVKSYLALHHRLIETGRCQELNFQVTFRCDRTIIDSVNTVFPSILNGEEGQARFVALQPRPAVETGLVVRLQLPLKHPVENKEKRAVLTRKEAKILAEWIKEKGCYQLGAKQWSEVAILCPKNDLLLVLAQALEEQGLKSQQQSTRAIKGDDPVIAWLTALTVIMSRPTDGFEIIGVLREIFGVSDDDLAQFRLHFESSSIIGMSNPFQIQQATIGSGCVADHLNQLHQIWMQIHQLPLCDGLQHLLNQILFCERIERLFGTEPLNSLHIFLAQAAIAEEQGDTLVDFSLFLRREFVKKQEEFAIDSNAIQLISCQKAKGLQWDCVIVPFLFRAIQFPHPSYPQLIRRPSEALELCLTKENPSKEQKTKQKKTEQQELARILYVTLTRSKRMLILVDDGCLFEKDKEKSFAELLQINPDQPNQSWWKQLPTELQVFEGKKEQKNSTGFIHSTFFDPNIIPQAQKISSQFLKRILPYSLAQHSLLESVENQITQNPDWPPGIAPTIAVQYGIWWHHLMQQIPWCSNLDKWEAHFQKELINSPLPKRSQKEWDRFKQSLLIKTLQITNQTIQTELPFVWKQSEGSCLEGAIDLAIWNEISKRWIIVDWKTDEVINISELEKKYQSQIHAYLQSLSNLTGYAVEGWIYSTFLGNHFVIVKCSEPSKSATLK